MELNYENLGSLALSALLFFAGWIIGLAVRERKNKRNDG